LLDGPHHFRVAVAEVDVDESRGEIEDPALARVEPGALGAGDDDLLDAALRGPGHEDVVGGVLGDRGRVGGALRGDGHRAESRPRKRTTAGTSPTVVHTERARALVPSGGHLDGGFLEARSVDIRA